MNILHCGWFISFYCFISVPGRHGSIVPYTHIRSLFCCVFVGLYFGIISVGPAFHKGFVCVLLPRLLLLLSLLSSIINMGIHCSRFWCAFVPKHSRLKAPFWLFRDLLRPPPKERRKGEKLQLLDTGCKASFCSSGLSQNSLCDVFPQFHCWFFSNWISFLFPLQFDDYYFTHLKDFYLGFCCIAWSSITSLRKYI